MASSFTRKLESLQKVVMHLSSAYHQSDIPDEFWIPTVITYFKLSFELSWKTMKRHLQDRYIAEAATGSPRDILKLAYREHYIIDDSLWLNMLENKNILEHQYDIEVSQDMLQRIGENYLPELERLLAYLSGLDTA